MDMMLSKVEGKIVFHFKPEEVKDSLILLENIFYEEKWKGNPVPKFDDDFFEKFDIPKDGLIIEFVFKYLSIAIRFIEEVIKITGEDGGVTESFEIFLSQIQEYHPEIHSLQ